MTMDSSVLYILVNELKDLLIPSQVRQIRQIDARIIDMEVFCPHSTPQHIIFDTYLPSVYISRKNNLKDNGYTASQTFCMTLRKHLEGARLSSIEQLHFDRILKFNFDRIETAGIIHTKSLYVELIPSAPNLILVSNGQIIDACLRGQKMNRFIAPGKPYQNQSYSDRINILQFTEDEIQSIFQFARNSDISLEQWIYNTFNGFSRILLQEVCTRAIVSPNELLSSFTNTQIASLSCAIVDISKKIQSSNCLYIYDENGKKQFASPFPLTGKTSNKTMSAIEWTELNANLVGGLIAPTQQFLQKKIKTLLKKEEKKIDKINQELTETHQMDLYKHRGELLAIYAYKKSENRNEITVSDLFSTPPIDETIPINPLITIAANSQQYFKKYTKMKTRLQIGKEKLHECQLKIEYLKNIAYFIDTMTTKNDLLSVQEELKNSGISKDIKKNQPKKVKTSSSDINTVSIEGFNIYIGKNNTQNEFLTFHKAQKHDLWFHAKSIPGSHVVIETKGQLVPKSTIAKTASLAAYHSKGKNSGKVDIDFTLIKYVKKIPNSPPGLVSYTHQHTVVSIPLSLKEINTK